MTSKLLRNCLPVKLSKKLTLIVIFFAGKKKLIQIKKKPMMKKPMIKMKKQIVKIPMQLELIAMQIVKNPM